METTELTPTYLRLVSDWCEACNTLDVSTHYEALAAWHRSLTALENGYTFCLALAAVREQRRGDAE